MYCITRICDTKGTKHETIENCYMHVSVFILGYIISDQVFFFANNGNPLSQLICVYSLAFVLLFHMLLCFSKFYLILVVSTAFSL
jgi:hypothetical protein